ncbi:hypothetical protein [Hoeflea sp. IMCC20628]|uniref:hypothetical protein n=1 Tax=Hoeflea sp. IMCC20628 TaxID=1620421 RepID=UPI001FD936E1|nr:hypothetical protein [Hoeflea sp. IMCC20628]
MLTGNDEGGTLCQLQLPGRFTDSEQQFSVIVEDALFGRGGLINVELDNLGEPDLLILPQIFMCVDILGNSGSLHVRDERELTGQVPV